MYDYVSGNIILEF